MTRTFRALLVCYLLLLSCESSNKEVKSNSSSKLEESFVDEGKTQAADTLDTEQNPDSLTRTSTLPRTCLDLVTAILENSPKYQSITEGLLDAIIENGGISFGTTLEGSPNPESDFAQEYSENYDFNLHESYPERMHVIDRFSYSPSKQQLYYYNVIEDSMVPIEFDRSYLNASEICK